MAPMRHAWYGLARFLVVAFVALFCFLVASPVRADTVNLTFGYAKEGVGLPDYYNGAVSLTRMYYYSLSSPGSTQVPSWIPLKDYGALCKDDMYNLIYYGTGNLVVMEQDPITLQLSLARSLYVNEAYESACYFPNRNQFYHISFSLSAEIVISLLSRSSGVVQGWGTTITGPPFGNPLTTTTTSTTTSTTTTTTTTTSTTSTTSTETPMNTSAANSDMRSRTRAASLLSSEGLVSPFPRKPFGVDQTDYAVFPFDNGCIVFGKLGAYTYTYAWTRLENIVQVAPHPVAQSIFYALGYTNMAANEWTVLIYPTNPDLGSATIYTQKQPEDIPMLDPLSSLNATVMEELRTQCSDCEPVVFTVHLRGIGLVMQSPSQQLMFIALVPHWSLSGPNWGHGDKPPEGDWTSTTDAPHSTPEASGTTAPITYTLVRPLIDELCNVSFVMHDEYTDSLIVSMSCVSYGSQLVVVLLSTLEVAAHLTLSLPGSSTPYIALSGIIDPRSRTVKVLVPRVPTTQAIMDVSLVAPASVTPAVVVDGSTIAIRGHGFIRRMVCFFPDHNNTFADIVFHNQSMVECVVPPVLELSRQPLRVQLQLMPSDIADASEMPDCDCTFLFQPVGNLTILQVRKPTAEKAVECQTGNYFAAAQNACLHVSGEAFVEPEIAPDQKCKLYTEAINFPSYVTNVTFLNTREIVCQFGSDVVPLPEPVRVTIAVDGVLFSDGGPTFSLLGDPVGITVVSIGWQNVSSIGSDVSWEAITTAATVTHVPAIVISIVDDVNHVIWPMDYDGAMDGIVIGWQQVTPVDPVNTHSASRVRGTTQTALASNGTATFTDLVLDCPQVGLIQLQFYVVSAPANLTNLGMSTVPVRVQINEGTPYSLTFVRQPSASVSPSVPLVQLQPIIGIVDICNNVFRTLTRSDIGVVDITVESYNFTSRATYTTRWELSPYNNLYYTTNVSVAGRHNSNYTILIESPGLTVPRVVADTVRVEWCDPDRLAVIETGACVSCPEYAQCNGTDVFLLQRGWWSPGEGSTDFFNCANIYDDGVCLQEGACKSGYTGIRCAQCDRSHRRVGTTCAQCPATSLNNFFIFLMCLFYVLAALAFVVFMVVSPPASPLVWACKTIVLILQFTGLYYSLALAWTNDARRLFAGTYSLTDLTTVVTSCSMPRSGSNIWMFVMPIVLWCVLAVLGRWVVLLMHFDRLDAHTLVAIVIKAYSHVKCQEFLEMRRELVRRYSAQNPQDNDVSGRYANSNAALSTNNTVTFGDSNRDQFDGTGTRFSLGASTSVQSQQQQQPFHDSERSPRRPAHALETSVIALFEAATGIEHRRLSDKDLCEALLNLSDEQLDSISRIQLPLPSRTEVEAWTQMRESRKATVDGSTADDAGARTHSQPLEDGAADTNISVEENYRLLAVRQFRTNWLGLCLNEFAVIIVVFYIPILLNAFQWQRCQALNYGVGDVRRVAIRDNSLSCDSSEYHNARNLGIASIVLYGVAAPLTLLAVSIYYKTRYGLDVAVAVFPTLHFSLPPRGALYEFVIFAEKFLMCVAVTFGRHALLQSAVLVWLIGARMLLDAAISPYPQSGPTRPTLATMGGFLTLGRAMRWTNLLLFLMANVVLIAAYVSQSEEDTFSSRAASFLTALLIIFFALSLLINLWLAFMTNVELIRARCGKTRASAAAERDAVFVSLVDMYSRICATTRYYAEVCDRGLEVAIYLDRIKKLNEESPIDDDLLRTIANEEERTVEDVAGRARGGSMPQRYGSSASVSTWGSQAHNTMSAAMRASSTGHTLPAPTAVRSGQDALLRPWNEPPMPTLEPSELVVSEDGTTKQTPATARDTAPFVGPSDEKPADGASTNATITTTATGTATATGAESRKDTAATSSAAAATTPLPDEVSASASPAADIVKQFASVPAPCAQPSLHRRSSSLFSIRHLERSPVNAEDLAVCVGRGGDVPPIVAGLVPYGGAPPPQLMPATPAVGFQSFSRPTVEVDLATNFDPFKVAPLPAPRARGRSLKHAKTKAAPAGAGADGGRHHHAHDETIAEEVQALGLDRDVVVRGSLLDLSGIDVSELRSILDGAQISFGHLAGEEGTATASGGVDAATPRSPQLLRDSPGSPPHMYPRSYSPTSFSEAPQPDQRPTAPPLPRFRTISSRPQARSNDPRRSRPAAPATQKSSKPRSSSSKAKKK